MIIVGTLESMEELAGVHLQLTMLENTAGVPKTALWVRMITFDNPLDNWIFKILTFTIK